MSLINEALKKAQRMRHEEQAGEAAPAPAGGRIAKRKPPRSAQAMLMIAGGALLLALVAVVAIVWALNRPAPNPEAPVSAPAALATSASPAAPPEKTPPAIVPPTITPPATSLPTDPAGTSPTAPTDASAAAPILPAPARTAATSAAPTALDASAPTRIAAAANPAPDERVQAFVDSIRVAGIRSSGNDSRVLMNDRVYRVNDVVERTLGVRLVKVAVDSLTFSDANGVTYVKYF